MIEEICRYLNDCENAKRTGLDCENRDSCDFYDPEPLYDGQPLGVGAMVIPCNYSQKKPDTQNI